LYLVPLFGTSGQIAKVNDIEIWYETFGEKKDPAVMLIMGALGQGILWPTEFCEHLARSGYYVIRYDHRDTGLSSCFDFEKNPYDLLDMAKDAAGLLEHLSVFNAHLCGLSMGGPVAQLVSVHFPERVASLTLLATSCDLRPCIRAFEGLDSQESPLSRPKQIYIDWMQKFLQSPPQTQEEQLDERVICWHILNGSVIPFEEQRYREIHREFLMRQIHPESLTNHMGAIKNSYDMIQTVPGLVTVSTVVIQGSEDPILQQDHGEALSRSIANSRYLFVEGLGHVPNCHFYDLFTQEIKKHASEQACIVL